MPHKDIPLVATRKPYLKGLGYPRSPPIVRPLSPLAAGKTVIRFRPERPNSWNDHPVYADLDSIPSLECSTIDKWRLIPSSIKQAMRENLPLRDLYRLKDHGKLTEEDIVDIVEARFGERLKPFGLNGEFVLRLIEKTDAVISGSFVLAVLFPSLFSPKDIDFFISPGRHQLLMKALRTCGYTDSVVWVPQSPFKTGQKGPASMTTRAYNGSQPSEGTAEPSDAEMEGVHQEHMSESNASMDEDSEQSEGDMDDEWGKGEGEDDDMGDDSGNGTGDEMDDDYVDEDSDTDREEEEGDNEEEGTEDEDEDEDCDEDSESEEGEDKEGESEEDEDEEGESEEDEAEESDHEDDEGDNWEESDEDDRDEEGSDEGDSYEECDEDEDDYCPSKEDQHLCRDVRRNGSGAAQDHEEDSDRWEMDVIDEYLATSEEGEDHVPDAQSGAKGEGKKATYHCLRGIRRMFEVTNPTTGKTINIIESSLETPLAPLPFFHSSLVMNYIAFHGLVVLHPRTTVEGIGHKNRCLTSSSSIKTEEAWEKYTDRGFHLVDNAKELEIFDRHVCKKSFACPSTRRHLEDEGVLHIPFRAFEDKDEAELAELRFSEEGKEGLFEWGLACQGECGGDSSYESMPYISFKRGDSYIFGRMET